MPISQAKKTAEEVAKYADMFSAMGTEARLRIMQILLSAHPEGLVVGEIQEGLDIPNSTLFTISKSSGTKGWLKCAAKALFFDTPQNPGTSRSVAVPVRGMLHPVQVTQTPRCSSDL